MGKSLRMRISLRGMFNNILRDKVKKKDINYVEAILVHQLYKDLKTAVKCKSPKEYQSFVTESIDFYCLG